MKEIKAYIQKRKLAPVTLALHKIEGLTGLSVTDVRGFGRGRAKDQPHRVVDDLVDYVTGVKLEIVCRDDLVEDVVRAIEQTAHTGLKGDGKIYVSGVEQAVRISTGERGEPAV
ncbi:MAG: P-II family nitrogen regulator [Proteobacteria bacterium]|nr:P-II family nitrogen regulator [Pseudomonadota bacterium]